MPNLKSVTFLNDHSYVPTSSYWTSAFILLPGYFLIYIFHPYSMTLIKDPTLIPAIITFNQTTSLQSCLLSKWLSILHNDPSKTHIWSCTVLLETSKCTSLLLKQILLNSLQNRLWSGSCSPSSIISATWLPKLLVYHLPGILKDF